MTAQDTAGLVEQIRAAADITGDELLQAAAGALEAMGRELAEARAEFERLKTWHSAALDTAESNTPSQAERAEAIARKAGWYPAICKPGKITRSSKRHQGGVFVDSWEQACEYDSLPFSASPPAEALPSQTSGAEAVGEIVMFEGVGKEVSWHKGKMPPAGTKLYPSADEIDHFHASRAAYFAAGGQRSDPLREQKISDIQAAIRDGKDGALAKPASEPAGGGVRAWHDVLAERRRQVEVEGWSASHDDEHGNGEMARAAAAYALEHAAWTYTETPSSRLMEAARSVWPWGREWWKPGAGRRMLVKAAALILAEIERLDRKEGAR